MFVSKGHVRRRRGGEGFQSQIVLLRVWCVLWCFVSLVSPCCCGPQVCNSEKGQSVSHVFHPSRLPVPVEVGARGGALFLLRDPLRLPQRTPPSSSVDSEPVSVNFILPKVGHGSCCRPGAGGHGSWKFDAARMEVEDHPEARLHKPQRPGLSHPSAVSDPLNLLPPSFTPRTLTNPQHLSAVLRSNCKCNCKRFSEAKIS